MSLKNPKIALAHEFLVHFGGAEKTFDAICELFPEATIFTAKYDKERILKMMPALATRKIIAPNNGFVNKASKYFFTFMMAPVFENMDFRDYDLIISDGNTWNKGILTKPNQLHITYVHTPPRFLYGYSTESTKRDKWYFKLAFAYIDNLLRIWDYIAAQRPDYMLVNSKEVQRRVKKFYKRDSTIIYPPVDMLFQDTSGKDNLVKPYYVAVGRLVRFKNFGPLISAFNLLGYNLHIVGTGPQLETLKQMAGPNITFRGQLQDEEKYKVISGALGQINPVSDEDFGIVTVEAHVNGIPVLAHKSGGHLETVTPGENGMFFESLEVEPLVEKIKEFDSAIRTGRFNKQKIADGSKKYSKERFQKEFKEFVSQKWEEFTATQTNHGA